MGLRRFFFCVPLLLAACHASTSDDGAEGSNDAITSNEGNILDFRIEASVVAGKDEKARQAIVSQLYYVQGILTTAGNGNGHVGQVTILSSEETVTGETKTITYKASLPVAFPKDLDKPTSYALALPKDATKLDAFNAKYDGHCGTNEYGQENFWHDWNPKAPGCAMDDADVLKVTAQVTPYAGETKNKYPEYDLIWQDNRLDIVAIFGIIEGDTPSDEGYQQAQLFLDHAKSGLTGAQLKDNARSASELKNQTLTGKSNGRDVKIDLIVVQELQYVGADFDTWYDPLSEKADMILYNGHAGLGKNVNFLARHGKVAPRKYQMMLFDGCQTFAYMDTTVTDRRIEANGAADDPNGTKYLDMVGNALPGYASNLAQMSNALYDGVVGNAQPKSYNQLLSNMPAEHIVVVFGEEDNRFTP